MGTTKEDFRKMGIYDGMVLIDPNRLFRILPSVLVDDEKKEKSNGEHYDKRGEGDYSHE